MRGKRTGARLSEVEQAWRLLLGGGAEKIVDEGCQMVTLDVDQVSRPLALRDMADVRKPLVSGLLETSQLWTGLQRRLPRKQTVSSPDTPWRTILFVRPREPVNSVVSLPLAERILADYGRGPNFARTELESSGGAGAAVLEPSPPEEEGTPICALRKPMTVRVDDCEAHETAGPTPYQDWCAHCVAAARCGDQHVRQVSWRRRTSSW